MSGSLVRVNFVRQPRSTMTAAVCLILFLTWVYLSWSHVGAPIFGALADRKTDPFQAISSAFFGIVWAAIGIALTKPLWIRATPKTLGSPFELTNTKALDVSEDLFGSSTRVLVSEGIIVDQPKGHFAQGDLCSGKVVRTGSTSGFAPYANQTFPSFHEIQ